MCVDARLTNIALRCGSKKKPICKFYEFGKFVNVSLDQFKYIPQNVLSTKYKKLSFSDRLTIESLIPKILTFRDISCGGDESRSSGDATKTSKIVKLQLKFTQYRDVYVVLFTLTHPHCKELLD